MSRATEPLPGGHGLYEVRFHGRGGQGTVVASTLLAQAAFLEGRDVQAFPFFGVERRGAPVVAHTRIGEDQVRLTTSVPHPDAIIVMDPTLVHRGGSFFSSLRPGGVVLVNSKHVPQDFNVTVDGTLASVDAAGIATRHKLGSMTNPIVNTVILGAFTRLTKVVRLGSLEEAIQEKVPGHAEANVQAAREAYETVGIP